MSWFWQRKKQPTQPDWADVIGDYGTVLESNKPGVGGSQPAEALPYDKETIKSALIEAANQDNLPDQMLNALGVAYVSLANFRAGGGESRTPKPSVDEVRNMTKEQLTDFAKQWDSQGEVAMAEAILADSKILMDEWDVIKAGRAR